MKKIGQYIPCALCNKKRYLQPNQIRKNNFCSYNCHNEYRKIYKPNQHLRKRTEKTCIVCDSIMFVIPSKYNRKKTCSRKCWKKSIVKSDEHKRQTRLALNRKKRAKRKQLQESYDRLDAQITMREFSNQCFNCKSNKALHIDHHYPFCGGNKLTLYNAVVLCRSCNSRKGYKNPKKFYTLGKLKLLENKLKIVGMYYNFFNRQYLEDKYGTKQRNFTPTSKKGL